MSESFLNGRVTLHCGDCLNVLATLPENSIDSCVTDPPYGLQFMGREWDKLWRNRSDADQAYIEKIGPSLGARLRNKSVDYRSNPQQMQSFHEAWARQVYRVLKPGAHLLTFGGTRTYHRMACAIEDAGFEIRDCIQWLYGSGFPKSHDVSKGINRAAKAEREIIGQYNARGFSDVSPTNDGRNQWAAGDVSDKVGFITAPATNAARQWQGWGTALKPCAELVVMARKPLSERTVAANVLRWGTGAINIDSCRVSSGEHKAGGSNGCNDRSHTNGQRTSIRNTVRLEMSAAQRDEHNPHSSSKFGHASDHQQFLNSQDDCQICPRCGGEFPPLVAICDQDGVPLPDDAGTFRIRDLCPKCGHSRADLSMPSDNPTLDIKPKGRWPGNLIHDGSEEVVGAFPESKSAGEYKDPYESRSKLIVAETFQEGWKQFTGGYWARIETPTTIYPIRPDGSLPEPIEKRGGRGGVTNFNQQAKRNNYYAGDEGSAARFFYTSKADADDRLGSKHPTVKPLDLMQYLVRLVTPKGGTVLDPFAGTGTTGEAAWREGMNAVLIEREAEYQADIRRRMELCLSGPDERQRQSFKAKLKDKPANHGPLFGGIA